MKPFSILIVFTLLYNSTICASNRVNYDKVVFADYQNKIYKVSYRDMGNLAEIKNLDEKYVTQSDWHHIISDGETEIAKALIVKLASYLPKDELWPYIETGLLRKENKLNDLVADTAYYHWALFELGEKLTSIRSKTRYRKNLSVLSQWNSLFAEPVNPNITVNQAVQKLMLLPHVVENQDKAYAKSLRTTIALSSETEQLKTLAYHENPHIALASYYALSKLIPREVAFDILSHAIFREEQISYSYISGGDVIMSGNKLTLGEAAYDLFSDYLSTKNMRKIMYRDPLLDSNIGQRRFVLRSKQVFYTIMHIDINSDNYKGIIKRWKLKGRLHRYEVEYFKYLIKTQGFIERALQQPVMTENLAQAIIELSDEDEYIETFNDNIFEWVYVAFKVHNPAAKKLIQYFLSQNNPSIASDKILRSLNDQYNWPRDWQVEKQTVKEMMNE
ncbi:MAG: hypothetical protein AB8B80_09340 [Marinicellaceae bacterium]